MLVWDVIELTVPEFTITNHHYECHQTDDAYRDCYSSKSKYTRKENPMSFPVGAELTKKRQDNYAQIVRSEKRQAVQGIVQKLIVMFIDVIIFFVHWKLAARALGEDS